MLGCTFSEEEFPSAEPLPSVRLRVVKILCAHHGGGAAVSILHVRTREPREIRNLPRSHSRHAAEFGLGHKSVCPKLP